MKNNRKQYRILIFSLFFLTFFNLASAQQDTTKQNVDSLNNAVLDEYVAKLKEIEKQRVADSLKKVELEEQLKSLKTTDNLKKLKLQQQLNDLESKEQKRLEKKRAEIDSLRATAKSYPVLGFFKEKLFFIYSKSGSLSPKERAATITKRIHNLKTIFNFNKDSLKLIETESIIEVSYNETIIMTVSEDDALWNNKTQKELAEEYKTKIGKAVETYKENTSISTILKEVGFALIALIALIISIFYTGKLFSWTANKIEEQEGKKITGIKIKEYQLFSTEQQVKLFLYINKIVKWLAILLLTYITLPIIFSIFPWTKGLADTLFGYILNPIKNILTNIWLYLPNLFTIIVIIIFFRYALKGIYWLKSEVEEGDLKISGFYPDWANPTYQIIKVLLYAFALILIFPYLPGSDSPIFQGVSVFLGFIFTFGSASSLSNIVAGIILTYMRLFKIGDFVKIGEVSGDVVEKSLLVTRIRTKKNEIVSIPNSSVMSGHTINYSSEAPNSGLIIYSTVTIGYDVPWKKMHEILIEAALRTEFVERKPQPFVLQTSLDDFYVSYQINAYTKESNMQPKIYSNLHQNIQDVCFENGVEILSPHYRAPRDGNMTTIPANYLDKDYEAPKFNINIDKK